MRARHVMLFAAAGLAAAGTPAGEIDEVRLQHKALTERLETCTLVVQTIFVKLRSRQPIDTADDPAKCATDGKTDAKAAFDKVRSTLGKKKPPPELADWRLEWMTAFDGAVPLNSENEREYIQRQSQARTGLNRAANKLELSFD